MFGTFAACGDDGPHDNNNQPACPEGFRAEDPACVPVFDDPDACRGPAEMPALGGGCRTVGILSCAPGFTRDGEGGCEPILPPGPDPCPAGTMERIGQTDCQSVGVPTCADGFVSDGEGGCEAVLPAGPDPCPLGTIAQIGEDTCQPLTDCGPDPSEGGSPWGLVAVDGTTVYVDATADASGADGTAAAPFPTVALAIDAAASGGQVAIAAGEYEEYLTIDKPLRLVGRCSELVTLRGRTQLGQPRPALTIAAQGAGSEVRGVTLTGPGVGLQVSGAAQVVVEAAEITGTGSQGVNLGAESEVTLRRVRVSACTKLGIASGDSELRLVQSVVEDTLPEPDNDTFGQGIQAYCSHASRCGSLRVERSLIRGNRGLGLFIGGVDTTVIASVVRDTLPQEDNRAFGSGIGAQCVDSLGVCGSLHVEGSLVAGNRSTGIGTSGVEVTVLDSVVRDTEAQENDRTLGRGITVQCDAPLERCGSLWVEGSLVAGNRQAGISAVGVDTTVVSSLVRDTRSRLRDQEAGWGIAVQCDVSVAICPSLRVEQSLVAGSREAGIIADGVTTTVTQSVVRDTLSLESDQSAGRGINVQCHPSLEICGSLRVEESIVTGNREFGLFAGGVDTVVTSSVVRDTLAQESDQSAGRGINVLCHPGTGLCGTLLVEGSQIVGNREVGIALFGVEATVTSSVIRDTLPQDADQGGGFGIAAKCHEDLGICGSIRVEACLVAENRAVAVITEGTDTEVVATIVRDTLAEESSQQYGGGISAQCLTSLGTCGSLHVEDTLVHGNLSVGVFAAGVEASVVSSVIRDTQPCADDHSLGRGINAQCHLEVGVCGHLALTDTLVTRSEDVGVFLLGVPGVFQGLAVSDTRTNAAGPSAGGHGQGVWSLCDSYAGTCGTLSMTHSRVSQSHGSGVALEGVSGSVVGCQVDTVLAQPSDGKYGYGVQIGGIPGLAMPTVHLSQCVIRDARLAGVLYYRSQGTLSGSSISGGEYSVAMNEGSSPTIAKDNQLSGTVRDDPQWASLFPSPAPPPTTPLTTEGLEAE